MSKVGEKRCLDIAISAGLSGKSLANFMATIAVETGFNMVRESHKYRPAKAKDTFGALKSMPIVLIEAIIDAGPEEFFEAVYGAHTAKGEEIGNRKKGDGFAYRGGGMIQLTGLDMYQAFQQASGLPVVRDPDLLARDEDAAIKSALWYWQTYVVSRGKDQDITSATRVVNGPKMVALAERRKLAKGYESALV